MRRQQECAVSRDATPQGAAIYPHEKAYILLAAGNAGMREDMSRLLLARGYEVKLAGDGYEALGAAFKRPPDLVIADTMMPRLDGVGLLKALRAEPILCELPVIFLSVRADEEERIDSLELDYDDYLIKPFSSRELLARVASILALSRRRRKGAAVRFRTNLLQAMHGMLMALAHEAQQPLAASALYLKTARRLLQKPPEQRIASVEDILVSAEAQIMRAGEIIGHLRELIPSDESDKFYENLHGLIEEVQQIVRAQAKQGSCLVTLKLRAENDCVLMNRVQIKQVIIHLMRNAVDAMSALEKCELTVSTSVIDQRMIQCDVVTSSGISEGTKAFLFEPFKSSNAHGMPVGLLISRTIVEGHYGRIWVEPSPEGGAVFSLTLPLAAPECDQREMTAV